MEQVKQESPMPTLEQVLEHYEQKITLAKLRKELSELERAIAENEAHTLMARLTMRSATEPNNEEDKDA